MSSLFVNLTIWPGPVSSLYHRGYLMGCFCHRAWGIAFLASLRNTTLLSMKIPFVSHWLDSLTQMTVLFTTLANMVSKKTKLYPLFVGFCFFCSIVYVSLEGKFPSNSTLKIYSMFYDALSFKICISFPSLCETHCGFLRWVIFWYCHIKVVTMTETLSHCLSVFHSFFNCLCKISTTPQIPWLLSRIAVDLWTWGQWVHLTCNVVWFLVC